jgi:cytoskeletal protein RodZ
MQAEAGTDTGSATEAVAGAAQTALERVQEARAEGNPTLALSGLGLRDLPDEVRALTGLRELDLSDNELTSLPPWIATFPDLRVLDLRRNHLVEVPWQLGTLELSSLALDGNPHLLLPPPETVAQGTAAVLADLRASAQIHEGGGTASDAVLVLPGFAAPEDAELVDQKSVAPSGENLGTDSGPLSSTVSRVAAVSGAAVLLLAAVGVAAAVGSGGKTSHQAAQGPPAGPGGSASGNLDGLAAAGLAGAPTGSTTSSSAAAGPDSTNGAPAVPPQVAVTVTATATQTTVVPAAPIVVTAHLPGTPLPSTTAVHVTVTKTTAPAVAKSKSAAAPAATSAANKLMAPAGPVTISVASATGRITGIGGMCIDDYASNTADYSEVDLWDCNGTGAQSWTWVESGSTLHVLGLCLDVQGSGTADGTTVDIYRCNGTGAQVFVPRSDGSLYNPNSGKCLDDPQGSTNRGTALQIWTCNGGLNQRWQLP